MNYLQMLGMITGTAASGVALWVAGYNWLALIQGLRGIRSSSPILFIAPLFAFTAGGLLAGALPQQPLFPLWLPGVLMLFIDPGSVPIIVWLLFKSRRSG